MNWVKITKSNWFRWIEKKQFRERYRRIYMKTLASWTSLFVVRACITVSHNLLRVCFFLFLDFVMKKKNVIFIIAHAKNDSRERERIFQDKKKQKIFFFFLQKVCTFSSEIDRIEKVTWNSDKLVFGISTNLHSVLNGYFWNTLPIRKSFSIFIFVFLCWFDDQHEAICFNDFLFK